jgi:hypothetical protein
VPKHPNLLRNLTLGTARQEPDPAINTWLEARDAVDPTADSAERLLATYAITERLHRLEPGPAVTLGETSSAPPDERPLPSPKLSRGFQLIMEGTYAKVLPEALGLLEEVGVQFPPFLLPKLLEKALEHQDGRPEFSRGLLRAAGPRGSWLAGLNPAWQTLASNYDLGVAWGREATPGRRTLLLKRWRQKDPTAAREALSVVWAKQSPKNQETFLEAMAVNLSAADQAWLRERLGPKRKSVRRAILKLLLQTGEELAVEQMTTLAAASLDEAGKITTLVSTLEGSEILDSYGGTQKNESLAGFLLNTLPPNLLPDLLGQTGSEFWVTLKKEELKLAAEALLQYDLPGLHAEFVRFACLVNPAQLPIEAAAKLTASLGQEDFLSIFHDLLEKEKNILHFGGVPRILALSRNEAWSERISKSFVLQLTSTLRDIQSVPYSMQQDLQSHWKLAIPLMNISTFGWMRTQLHSMTERADGFGKLAIELLQTTAFRRSLWARA